VDDAIGISEVLDEHHAPRFELRSHCRSDQGPLLGGGRRATIDGKDHRNTIAACSFGKIDAAGG
jgi:hypothetical protein